MQAAHHDEVADNKTAGVVINGGGGAGGVINEGGGVGHAAHPLKDSPWNTKDVMMEGLPGYLFRSFMRLLVSEDLHCLLE